MSDDIDTLRAFINFAHRDRNSPELLEQALTAYDALKRVSIDRDSLLANLERVKEAALKLIATIDNCPRYEIGVGGMTSEAQLRRTVINRVPAWDVEEAREIILSELSELSELSADAPAQRTQMVRDGETERAYAARYKWLRERDLETIRDGGVFIGKTPDNVALSFEDADAVIDAAIADAPAQQGPALLSQDEIDAFAKETIDIVEAAERAR